MGIKLLYAMEHADKILVGGNAKCDIKDLLTGILVAVILKILILQKQADAKSSRRESNMVPQDGGQRDIQALYVRRSWMNIPLTATEARDSWRADQKQPKYARNKILSSRQQQFGKNQF